MKTNNQNPTQERLFDRKKLLWSLLFAVIAVCSIWAVTAQLKDFSPADFREYVHGASLPWLLAAVLCMFGFIWFEGQALLCICKAFGYRQKQVHGFAYSAADIYFSAITPSASGGQPASAFFMIKDGIPTTLTAVALLGNLVMYTLSILLIGLLGFVIRPSVFLCFGTPSQLLIAVGAIVQIGLVVFFVLLVKNEQLLASICLFVFRLLSKLKLVRNRVEHKKEKLMKLMDNYRESTTLLNGQYRMLSQVFLLNFLQRLSQISVTACVFLATGGSPKQALDLIVMQSFTVLGSNCVPIPGAMGISDYLMLDGFGNLMSEESAVNLELLSRSISFYSCILISGVFILLYSILQRKRRKKA